MSMESRIPILAANWKMHKTEAEAVSFLEAFLPRVKEIKDREIVIAPAFTALSGVSRFLSREDPVYVAAQNMHWETHGAFTGEISTSMLNEFGVKRVIVGHSERRHIFGESDDLIARKVDAALKSDMHPILCIGETLRQREEGLTLGILEKQLDAGFRMVSEELAHNVVIAYEPVWAIGTGKTATPRQAQESHEQIRAWLSGKYHSTVAGQIRILYGGSVKPDNIDDLMALRDVDGVLVGGASLDPDNFARIANYKQKL